MSQRGGYFITFEGGEGTGKSTQIRRLSNTLIDQGIPVLLTREPGGTPGAEEIRKLLVEGNPDRWDTVTEALLMFAARRDHVARVIKPALAQGTCVLCDRFSDSSWVYQGYSGNLGTSIIENLTQLTIGDFSPDLTLVFDLPPDIGLLRAQAREKGQTINKAADRFEKKGAAFHERIRTGYQALLTRFPNRCVEISAIGSEEEVFERVFSIVKNKYMWEIVP